MANAENGARIKCWAGSGVGSGIVKNVTFSDFVVDSVDNPIIIDQVRSLVHYFRGGNDFNFVLVLHDLGRRLRRVSV